jgi:D-cysteine desulfhydrase family pyridoxal phosphate-dependent enzyme
MNTIPRVTFAHLPTPVEPLPRLSATLGGQPLFVKRDDLTGLALGGNKTRKLEFLVAEAQAQGARTLITAGAAQSNHCRQTAAAAARYGFACTLVLSGDPPSEPPAAPSGNLLLNELMGAALVWTNRARRDQTLRETFDSAWQAGKRPFLIPYGGSSPTGAAAYAFAVKELLDQGFQPDWIVFASSSGGTQAGLAAGARLFGYQGQILGISVDEPEETLKERVAKLATQTVDLLGEQAQFSPGEILVNAAYLGGGYGVVGVPEREAIRLFAQNEGLLLDPVYTGRAAAGLIDLLRRRFFAPGQSVLFWHTGGTPALFADQYSNSL